MKRLQYAPKKYIYRILVWTGSALDMEQYASTLPAIGGHCTSAAVLIGCHAQRNGPIESNGEILKYHSCGFIIDVSLFSTIKIDVLIHFKIISQIRSSLKIVETPPNEVL